MRTGVFLRWTAHPLTVGATAVLLLNDHVFKQAWPGLVTGKLSDVAGLVVAPPVLGLLLGLFLARRVAAAAAVLVTGAAFAVVKLTAAGAEAASAAWSVVNGPSFVLADPTDLVALPALGLSWWVWRRVSAAPPLPEGAAFRVRVVVVTPFALLAITATSAGWKHLPAVDSVKSEGTQVVIEAAGRIYGSTSGTGDWKFLEDVPPLTFPVPPPRRPQVQACVPQEAAHCYRVRAEGAVDAADTRGGRLLGVDETTDAGRTWQTAWEVPAARWPFVQRQHALPTSTPDVSDLSSREIAVRAVPGGHEVFVANGAEGMAVRGADGAWRRLPVVDDGTRLDIRPVPLTAFGQGIGDDVSSAGLLTLLALLIGTVVAAGRVRARVGRGLTSVAPLGLFVFLALPVTGLVAVVTSGSGLSTGPWLVTTVCLVGIGIGMTLATRALGRARMVAVVAAALSTGLAYVGPALGWTLGHPQEHAPAVRLGLVLAAVSLPVVVAAGWWAGGRRVDPRDEFPPPYPSYV